MTKAILTLSLLLALVSLPVAAERVKPPTPEETMLVIKNLKDTVEEQQERLTIHKLEIATLQRTVATLESRLASIEKSAANRPAPAEIRQRLQEPELTAGRSQEPTNSLSR
jgi:septal ring factor EnvC (AmiA/AmiB activator)